MGIKNAARAVVIDENNYVALISVRDGEYFKIPGGGIEEGESEEQAAKREVLEESGCEVELLRKIGRNEFIDNSQKSDETLHRSVCFLAKTIGNKKDPCFNDWEKSNRMKLIWVTFSKAIELFSNVKTTDLFGSEINKRDFEFVIKARNLLE